MPPYQYTGTTLAITHARVHDMSDGLKVCVGMSHSIAQCVDTFCQVIRGAIAILLPYIFLRAFHVV